eukprot:COSAG06_NODE_7_length_38054_cov_37.302569_24_plen_199_part_00
MDMMDVMDNPLRSTTTGTAVDSAGGGGIAAALDALATGAASAEETIVALGGRLAAQEAELAELRASVKTGGAAGRPGGLETAVRSILARVSSVPCNWHQAVIYALVAPQLGRPGDPPPPPELEVDQPAALESSAGEEQLPQPEASDGRAGRMYWIGLGFVLLQSCTALGMFVNSEDTSCVSSDQVSGYGSSLCHPLLG